MDLVCLFVCFCYVFAMCLLCFSQNENDCRSFINLMTQGMSIPMEETSQRAAHNAAVPVLSNMDFSQEQTCEIQLKNLRLHFSCFFCA